MFLFLDNVQFHSSLVDRVKEPSSNAPLVAPSHRKVLDIWLKELVDSDDEGFVTKVFVNVNVEDELTTEWVYFKRRRTLAPLHAPVHERELDRWFLVYLSFF